MFERILGPSVKYDTKTKTGTIKLRGGQSLGIKSEPSPISQDSILGTKDTFRLSYNGKDAAVVELYSGPMRIRKKEVHQGHIFIENLLRNTQEFTESGLRFLRMEDQKKIGKKLAKILGKNT